jgi:alkanesulfonate monooxygenase SsuD/methylene tetrahydromethanopterin reductase-like flavin-dependent oxidoreductase (luciferase family)
MEGWIALTALARATTRLRMGTLVTGIHYRHPAILANMATTLDIVSGGRLELGIGSGWNEEESGAYGIELGTPGQRSDRLEEACEVIIELLTQETTTFMGRYYQLSEARNEPKPVQRLTRRSASAGATRGGRYGQRPGSPNIGTSWAPAGGVRPQA